jgi:copper chaperone NosL
MDRRRAVSLLVLAVAAGACSRGPRALLAGTDTCAHCRMTIDDVRFGALVLTARGKLQTFDSIECLASYLATLPTGEQPRGSWVADFEHPSHWVDAEGATYLLESQLRSPMGRDLAAFASGSDTADLTRRYGGRPLDWQGVRALVTQPMGASSPSTPAARQQHAR